MNVPPLLLAALSATLLFALRELLENSAWVAERVVRRAARHIPVGSQEVTTAEWLAELDFIRERRSKIVLLCWAAFIYFRSWRQADILEGADSAVELASAVSAARDATGLHFATIEALALAIDAKDQSAQLHLRRVQAYATAVARGLGMSDEEVECVRTAALLHDIGKLAVPEHILSKPGPLTPEEFQKIRVHPQVGAEIIGAVPFPYPVAPLILSHHERWDGKGYPQGLKGEEIPLGARILSVVDYYDALTSDRPYHKAMTREAAFALLQKEAGRALDPRVVEVFAKVVREVEAADTAHGVVALERASLKPRLERGRLRGDHVQVSSKPNQVFEDIALAHREIYSLYEIAQTMGTSLGVADTMALVSSKLSHLVPFSACALFLYDEHTDSLRCRFATGIDADTIGGMTVRAGQGLSGWVLRNRRPLVNARPSAEFEAAGSSRATPLQSALVAPLVFSDRFVGTLALYSTQSDFYIDDHRRLVDRISEQTSAVVHNSIVFEQTQEDALTDALTGLPNEHLLVMHLTREVARAERTGTEVELLVVDLDNFKQVNDSLGHAVGDVLLQEVAKTLKSSVRPYDLCSRWFSDKFVVVRSRSQAGDSGEVFEPFPLSTGFTGESLLGAMHAFGLTSGSARYRSDGIEIKPLLELALKRTREKKAHKKGGAPPATGLS